MCSPFVSTGLKNSRAATGYALIERICNFVKSYKGDDPLTGFRNQEWRVGSYRRD